MALQCYHDAIDCADTTAADCDYAQLARVYGQMAGIFYYQGLYRGQLENTMMSVQYAWKGKDTLLALMNYEQESFAYINLGMQDSALFIVDDVASKYLSYGFSINSAIALGCVTRILVNRKEYVKARNYMDIYESNSGLFDTQGNIVSGREVYYSVKGLYYLYTNKLDSAEYYFRKELRDGKDFNNQNSAAKGLVKLYQRLHQPDSVAKYSVYAYAMSDSVYAHRTEKEVERIQAMYDYSRHQRKAYVESLMAARANKLLLISIISLLAILLLATWLYIARKKVIEILKTTSAKLDEIRMENKTLKQNAADNQLRINENEKRIKLLEKKLGRYGKIIYFGTGKAEECLNSSSTYLRFKEMARRGEKLSDSEWDSLYNVVNEYFSGFQDFMMTHFKIGSTEYRICVLLRLHFKPGEIANMLGVTPPYISKLSTAILDEFWKEKGSSKELYKELCKIS